MLSFAGRKILVVGDVMLDEYIITKISRISPEAPVPVALIEERRCVPGGAANVARNLANLGCSTFLCGLCGDDTHGAQLHSLLNGSGIHELISYTNERSTICKTRIVCMGQQLLRMDTEDRSPIPHRVLTGLWEMIAPHLLDMHAVILSDYGKGVFQQFGTHDSLATRIINKCGEAHIPVLVDPKGADWSAYSHAACITPNTRELAEATHKDPDDFSALCTGAHDLMKTHHLPRIAITRSEKGIALMEQDGKYMEIPAQAREVADVSGAGDTVIAVMAACVAGGSTWDEAAKMANYAAGIVVSKSGTCPIELGELRESHLNPNIRSNRQLSRINGKIHTLEQLLTQVDLWRGDGEKIVFTNGCFDLLHIGHIQLLWDAAAQGDRLIVALNSDASIRRLKGQGRPIQSEKTRSIVMAALEEVDAVILFDEDTPLRLVEALTPDVLVKGGDYDICNIIGAQHVIKAGGRIHLVNYISGVSTTAIIDNILENDR